MMQFGSGTYKAHPKRMFSEAEDAILIQLVAEHGTGDWMMISRKMIGRRARQCRERWENYLSPDVQNGPWTHEEEQHLLEVYNTVGAKWKHIATFFPSRTDINVKSRWQLIQRRINRPPAQPMKISLLGRKAGLPKVDQIKVGEDGDVGKDDPYYDIWESVSFEDGADLEMTEDFWYDQIK
jgi:hypothetical protein